jgi:hypothetical protein
MKLPSILLLTLTTLTTAIPSLTPRQSSKPYQIRGVTDPIFHLYLQSHPSTPSVPVMGPEATGEFFIIGSTIQSANSSLFLNIGTNSASYLPLSLDAAASTTAWGLEGDTIITEGASAYGRRAFRSPLPAGPAWGHDSS